MRRFVKYVTLSVTSLLLLANFAVSQTDSIYRLPAGTKIKLNLDAELSSKVASVNDTFIASVASPVSVREVVMVPAGTQIEAKVVAVEQADAGGQHGRLELTFTSLTISGKRRAIDASMTVEGRDETRRRFAVLSIIVGLAAGAAVGAASSTRGAALGAGIGGASGTAVALLRKGKEARVGKGQEFEIELKKEVILPVLDY